MLLLVLVKAEERVAKDGHALFDIRDELLQLAELIFGNATDKISSFVGRNGLQFCVSDRTTFFHFGI